jgi:hypothetical protein
MRAVPSSVSREVVSVPNILIRDLPEQVVAAIDANAQRLSLPQRVPAPAPWHRGASSCDSHGRRSQALGPGFADVNDAGVMSGAWS